MSAASYTRTSRKLSCIDGGPLISRAVHDMEALGAGPASDLPLVAAKKAELDENVKAMHAAIEQLKKTSDPLQKAVIRKSMKVRVCV